MKPKISFSLAQQFSSRAAKIFPLLFIILAISALMVFSACHRADQTSNKQMTSKVELVKTKSGFQLMVNGEPFYVKGAGLESGNIARLAAHGGNALRTWRTGDQFMSAGELLDEAQKHGIMVTMGIDIARERHGFDYNDQQAVKEQFERVKKDVLKHKDHPALMAWGIGNELNLHYSNPKVWEAVDDIARMIKEEDPNHLTTTMLAGADKEVVRRVMESCTNLDFLCFQIYGDILNLPGYIDESGYDGAYIVSEWGATGHWETPKTEWGRPIEQQSTEKADAYLERYERVIAANQEQCIGSFVFLWGQKQERTPTWYGMFLENGRKTASVDVMEYVWTNQWPEKRTPIMHQLLLDGKSAYDNVYLVANQNVEATVEAESHQNEKLRYLWEIMPEVPIEDQSDGGDFEQRPAAIFKMESDANTVKLKAPEKPGEYRLFVYVMDNFNSAATANIPFYVRSE
ncbi:MAG: hypothetical protein PF694_10755 [Bacteroidetes bacterium]|jgi:hypothetical protein|nr:hypothetical protein [Bacteroidota bacterium]